MPTQDEAVHSAEQLLSHAIQEDTAAAAALIDITLEILSLEREKCVVKEAAVLRLMQDVNPKAQEKNGVKALRSGTDAETVWETDEEASLWLARYHRKVAEKIATETRARQAGYRVAQAQVVFHRAMLGGVEIADAIGAATYTLQGSLEKHRNVLGDAVRKLADELGQLISEVPQLRGAIARIR